MTTQLIPLDKIVFGKAKNRHRIDPEKIKALAGSIKEHGLLHPVQLRHRDDGKYEVVAGERRVRAAKLLKTVAIEANVSGWSDACAAELRLVENCHREDLTPWELSDQLANLKTLHPKMRVEDLADRVKLPAPYVAKVLSFSRLIPDLKALVIDQAWPLSHVALLARQSEGSQALLLAEIQRQQSLPHENGFAHFDHGQGCVWPCAPELPELRAIIDEMERPIKAAKWKADDAKLVEAAGACTACPKRSSAQTLLFPDAEDPQHDYCLDAACWGRKEAAFVVLQVEKVRKQAKGKGVVLLTGEYGDAEVSESIAEALPEASPDQVKSIHAVDVVKKTAPNAQPAVVVSGRDAGKTLYVRPRQEPGKRKREVDQETGKAQPATKQERLVELLLKRKARAVVLWSAQLEHLHGQLAMNMDERLLRMAICVGLERRRNYRDDEETTWFEMETLVNTSYVTTEAWQQLYPVLEQRLRRFGSLESDGEAVWREAKSQAHYLGHSHTLQGLYDQAAAEIPLPKSLAKEGVADPDLELKKGA